MDRKKTVGPTPVKNNAGIHRSISGSAIGNKVQCLSSKKEKERVSEGDNVVDSVPPKPPPTAGNTGKTGLRLGGLSRYLLEKAQSNDSGLDLSPNTLQTLVHPLRPSNSSLSSLHVRNLFESPVSSADEFSQGSRDFHAPELSSKEPHNSSKNVLAEQSHNSTGTETTIIEKTLTEEQTCNDLHKRNALAPIHEDEQKAKVPKTKSKENLAPDNHHQQQGYHTNRPQHPDDVTPNNGGFHVPQEKTRRPSSSGYYTENTDPYDRAASRTQGGYQNQQSNSFQSSDIAAVIPSASEQTRKTAIQTPKPKNIVKKKPAGVPSSAKKPAAGSGWKFLSEHVQNQEFLILQQLGKGGCGEVSLVMEKDTRRQFALKIVPLHGLDEAMVKECINEVEMLIDLKGTDLVVDIFNWEFNRSEKTMKILMENGQCDLNHTIFKANKNKKPIKLIKMRYIWESMLTIVQEIHSKGIVHADLKPANFVWFNDNLKIIDFGIASRLQSDLTSIAMPNPKGTLNFISPEIIRQDNSGQSKLSPKSDIWALGCILYLMVYGRTPFEHVTHPVTKMNAIVQGDIVYPQLPPHLRGSDVVSVLKLCFQTDYKRRPSAAELLRHPFVAG